MFDPQVIWDPGTKRFYYASDDRESNTTDNRIAFGFSKTATPNNASSDFCHYFIKYGNEFPDYPKLGDSKDFMLLETNVFDASTSTLVYKRSDALGVSKPPNGTISTCPAPSSLKINRVKGLKSSDGSLAWTPVPANQMDSSATGWIVASANRTPAGYLSVFKVTKSARTGLPVFGPARKVTVPSYSVPPSAPQPHTSLKIDTSDTRLTQVVSAIDPSRGASGQVGIWTQHTVRGGAGAAVAWYDINPAGASLFQSGTISSPSLYAFNGAISPDRVVNGSTAAFGSHMVIGFNTGSASQPTSFQIASKIGTGPVSGWLSVEGSGSTITSDCRGAPCRWGDYAAATPDPSASPSASTGRVWLTSQLMYGPSDFNWTTWNVVATP